MDVSFFVKGNRKTLGFSQVELAGLAGIALPTLQQLEAGVSNPSLETIERLGRVLGCVLEFQPRPCNWDRLAAWGLPLMVTGPLCSHPAVFSKEDLWLELRCAVREISALSQGELAQNERKYLALSAILVALSDHFPAVFKANFGKNTEAKVLLTQKSSKVIKLRRLALSRLAEVL